MKALLSLKCFGLAHAILRVHGLHLDLEQGFSIALRIVGLVGGGVDAEGHLIVLRVVGRFFGDDRRQDHATIRREFGFTSAVLFCFPFRLRGPSVLLLALAAFTGFSFQLSRSWLQSRFLSLMIARAGLWRLRVELDSRDDRIVTAKLIGSVFGAFTMPPVAWRDLP